MIFSGWPTIAIVTDILLLLLGIGSLFFLWNCTANIRYIGGIIFLCLVWGCFIEPSRLVVREHIISEASLQGLRVGIISDLHVGFFTSHTRIEKVVCRLNSLELDVILIPGDFLYGKAEDFGGELESLSDLEVPVFATLGNHDHRFKMEDPGSDLLRERLKAFGVIELENSARPFQKNIWIVGVDDDYLGFDDLERAFQNVPENAATLLLAHTPDIIRKQLSRRANFTVTGHTHGGQIRAPWGSIPFVIPVNDPSYDQGVFELEKLLVSSGVGESGTRARFLNPPEIQVLEFVSPLES